MKFWARTAASISASAGLFSSVLWLNSANLQETAAKVTISAAQMAEMLATGKATGPHAAELAASAASAAVALGNMSMNLNIYAAGASVCASASLMILALFSD